MQYPRYQSNEKCIKVKRSHQRAKSQLSELQQGLEQAIKQHIKNKIKMKKQNKLANLDKNISKLVKKPKRQHFSLPQKSYSISLINCKNSHPLFPKIKIKTTIDQCREQTKDYLYQFNKQKQQSLKKNIKLEINKNLRIKTSQFSTIQQDLQYTPIHVQNFSQRDIKSQILNTSKILSKKISIRLPSENTIVDLPFVAGAKINTRKRTLQIKQIRQYLNQILPKKKNQCKNKQRKSSKIIPISYPLKSAKLQSYSPWQSHKSKFIEHQI